MPRLLSLLTLLVLAMPSLAADVVRSAQSGPWSAAATWENGKVPGDGARVLIRAGHDVTYDVQSDTPIRFVHVAGKLSFAPDKSTRLVTGLIISLAELAALGATAALVATVTRSGMAAILAPFLLALGAAAAGAYLGKDVQILPWPGYAAEALRTGMGSTYHWAILLGWSAAQSGDRWPQRPGARRCRVSTIDCNSFMNCWRCLPGRPSRMRWSTRRAAGSAARRTRRPSSVSFTA